MFSPSVDCHPDTQGNEVVNWHRNLLQPSNSSYYIIDRCHCVVHETMKAAWGSADLIRTFCGFHCVMSPGKALDLKQVTAKTWYTEFKLWNTRGLTLKGNRMLNTGSIKMVKKHSGKTSWNQEKAFIDGGIFLSGVWKQDMPFTTRFLGALPAQEKVIFIDSKALLYIYGEKYYPFVNIHYVHTKS